MNSVRFHVEAEAEPNEAVSFYEALVPGLGKSLITEVKKTVRLIQVHPAAGQNVSARLKKAWSIAFRIQSSTALMRNRF